MFHTPGVPTVPAEPKLLPEESNTLLLRRRIVGCFGEIFAALQIRALVSHWRGIQFLQRNQRARVGIVWFGCSSHGGRKRGKKRNVQRQKEKVVKVYQSKHSFIHSSSSVSGRRETSKSLFFPILYLAIDGHSYSGAVIGWCRRGLIFTSSWLTQYCPHSPPPPSLSAVHQ